MIAGTTTTMLRAGVTRSCAMQPLLIRTTAAAAATSTCAYSTFPSAPFSIRSKLSPLAPSTKPSSILLHTATPSTRRQASTTSSPGQEDAAAAARAARRAQQQIDPDAPPLDWNTFFQLRKTRRRWQVGFSVVMSLLSGTGGAMVLSTGLADPLTSQVPLDPVMTLGLMTMGFIALGWLAGPTLGSTVFYLMKRKYKGPMTLVSAASLFMLT